MIHSYIIYRYIETTFFQKLYSDPASWKLEKTTHSILKMASEVTLVGKCRLCMYSVLRPGLQPQACNAWRWQLRWFPFPDIQTLKAVCHRSVDELYWVFGENQCHQGTNGYVI